MKTIDPYELLIRQNADGSLKAAHKQNIERVTVDGEVLSERELSPEPILEADLADFLGDAASLIAQVGALTAERDAAVAQRDMVASERDTKQSALEDEQAGHAKANESRDQALTELEAVKAERDAALQACAAEKQALDAAKEQLALALYGSPVPGKAFRATLQHFDKLVPISSAINDIPDDQVLAQNASGDDVTGADAKLLFLTAEWFSPVDPLLNAVAKGQPINLTDEEIAEMFAYARTI